jgi:hypothetical protein
MMITPAEIEAVSAGDPAVLDPVRWAPGNNGPIPLHVRREVIARERRQAAERLARRSAQNGRDTAAELQQLRARIEAIEAFLGPDGEILIEGIGDGCLSVMSSISSAGSAAWKSGLWSSKPGPAGLFIVAFGVSRIRWATRRTIS